MYGRFQTSSSLGGLSDLGGLDGLGDLGVWTGLSGLICLGDLGDQDSLGDLGGVFVGIVNKVVPFCLFVFKKAKK